MGVAPFLFLRFLLMPLLGFALLAAVYRRHLAKSFPRREDLPRFVAAGLVGHTAHVGLVMWGMDLSTPFSSSLVLTSSPLFTLLILTLLGAERLQARQIDPCGSRAAARFRVQRLEPRQQARAFLEELRQLFVAARDRSSCAAAPCTTT